MTTVIGLDLSLRATGMVSWRNGRVYTATIGTDPREPREARHHTIVSRVLAQLDPQPGRTLVAVEARITPPDDAVQTAMDLAELRGVVNYGLHCRGVTRVDIHPMTLKVYATGNGKASKRDMVIAAHGWLGRHFYAATEDEADAGWLLAMAMNHYGDPLARMPEKNRRALERVTWRPFTLEERSHAPA